MQVHNALSYFSNMPRSFRKQLELTYQLQASTRRSRVGNPVHEEPLLSFVRSHGSPLPKYTQLPESSGWPLLKALVHRLGIHLGDARGDMRLVVGTNSLLPGSLDMKELREAR